MICEGSALQCVHCYYLHVGETGIGKSTLMESLFKEQFNDQPVTHRLKTVSVNHKTYGKIYLDYILCIYNYTYTMILCLEYTSVYIICTGYNL